MVSNDYIVGLTDGEGCFYVGIRYPIFEKHPLHSKKRHEFELFKTIFKLVEDKLYKTTTGLREVEKFKVAMNQRTRWMR